METSDTKLRSLIEGELGYLPADGSIDLFLSRGHLESYHRGEVVTGWGEVDPDVYVVKEGIIRFVDFNGERERTFAFALPGTVFFSKHSFVMGKESYYQIEACCPTELLRIPRDDFWEVAGASHELALWLLRYAHGELFYQEYKYAAVHNGSAAERYRKMLLDRPEIIRNVSQKIVASYLGVTPEYLSKLKRQFLKP